MADSYCQILLPLPLKDCFDYRVPDGMAVKPGDYVIVPFGKKEMAGVVWSGAGSGAVAADKIKSILKKLELPPMGGATRRFIDWAAAYTMNPRGAILKMATPIESVFFPPKETTLYIWNKDSAAEDLTEAQQKVRDALFNATPHSKTEIARRAKVSPAVVARLLSMGYLESVRVKKHLVEQEYVPAAITLSESQESAAAHLREKVSAHQFNVTLLEGVTGSGKTEVYFEAITECIRAGKQALVLLPEIALSAQWFRRFRDSFGAPPTLWHSDLTMTERRHNWLAIANGAAKVIVGARSALFLPYHNLGAIIVDEEHEAAFKQEEGVLYHGRDMAIVRAREENVPAILVSATPSLETLVNVQNRRFDFLHLPERHKDAAMPHITAIDLRKEKLPADRWISETLRVEIQKNLERGEQTLLFLNRRGYAPLTLCRACGNRLQCPQCSAWLVEHRKFRKLTCHHCAFEIPIPKTCPKCGAADSLHACGPGVERLQEEVAALFPAARLSSMTSDTVKSPKIAADLMQAMELREIDILIGTQIVAKGHHFPHLTLVGVIDADLGLAGGDLRAGERTYQLLLQVSGRSGRADLPGRCFVQTYMPEHPAIGALLNMDQERFIATEMESRKALHLPPFGRLAAIIVSGREQDKVARFAHELRRLAPHMEGIDILGPAPAPLSLLRGNYRYRFLIKAPRNIKIQEVLDGWTKNVKTPSSMRVQIDIDPYSFM